MPDQQLRDIIQQGYRDFLERRELKPRLGQRQMIAQIARTLTDQEGEKICVVEAGTGTGKTVAYLLAALPIARELGKTLVVATGTVALQEQLVHKDLPELLDACGWDYRCTLVKGRGRYVCNLRLEQCRTAITARDSGIFLFEDELQFSPDKQTEKLYQALAASLESGDWFGDRDSWPDFIADRDWRPLTIDRRQCTGRRCRFINQCPFFQSREELENSDCIIANHDLVMADLALGGGAILPDPSDCIFIFDEAHRLGDTAVRHFGADCRINGSVTWLERMQNQIRGQRPLFEQDEKLVAQLQPIEQGAQEMRDLLGLTYPLLHELVQSSERGDRRYRFKLGDVGPAIRDLAEQITAHCSRWLGRIEVLADHVSESLSDRDYPLPPPDVELLYQQVGAWQSRAENLLALWDRLRHKGDDGGPPLACWLSLEDSGAGVDIGVHSSPIRAAEILAEQLWNRCQGAVLTSATLRSLGSFDALCRETGLPEDTAFEAVSGAFDYANAATLRVPADAVEGNSVEAHNRYLVDQLPSLFERHKGNLVLFASRRQMQEVHDALEPETQKQVLMQGQYSNRELIRLHRERVDQGDTSVLFGLASFAEGVDLPGDYCRQVIIAKLPFAVPDDPLQESLAEWIEINGGNAFMEMSLPAASLRLIQACGRLLRNETDTGIVTILDRRLVSKRYGKRLLDALPPFAREIE